MIISCKQDTNKIASPNQARIKIQLTVTTNLSNMKAELIPLI